MELLIAQIILALHIAAAIYIIAGVILTPAIVYFGWSFPGLFWFRLTHVLVFGTVVVQKWFGQVCCAPWAVCGSARALSLPLSFVTITYSALWFYMMVLWYTGSVKRPAADRFRHS